MSTELRHIATLIALLLSTMTGSLRAQMPSHGDEEPCVCQRRLADDQPLGLHSDRPQAAAGLLPGAGRRLTRQAALTADHRQALPAPMRGAGAPRAPGG